MIYPVKNPIVTSGYGNRLLNGVKNFHDGIDFVSGSGDQTVFAVADGTVVYDFDAYDDALRWIDQKMGAGNYVILSHVFNGEIFFCRYIHLGGNTVSHGQKISEGSSIGVYADVGYSYGAHLHFDIYDKNWKKIDPTPYFNGARDYGKKQT
jgi:murein DD-endopeptidase MepM/ murein hydrolase activator NlpD